MHSKSPHKVQALLHTGEKVEPPCVFRGDPGSLSGFAPRQGPLRLAGSPQLLAAPSGDDDANVSGCILMAGGISM